MSKAKGSKKYMGLVKRGNTYYADWAFGGKRYRVSTGTGDRDAAAAMRKTIVENFVKEHTTAEVLTSVKKSLQKASRRNLSIKDAWDTYEADVETKRISPTTRYAYVSRAKAFARWTASKHIENIDDVTLRVARDFMASISNGISGKTFNDYLAIFSKMWDTFVKVGYADTNPWKQITRLDKDTHTKSELSTEQLNALFDATSANPEMRLLFGIGIYTGLRLEDCATLEWNEVDLAAHFIRAKPAKTRRHNIVVNIPLVEPLYNALSAAYSDGRGFVLPAIAARYRNSHKLVSKDVMKIFDIAGIKVQSRIEGRTRAATDYGFHSLRHTFVSLAARYGIPLPIVQSIVGHTNAAMTLHYTHTTDEQLTSAMEAFPVVGKTLALPVPASAFASKVDSFLEGLTHDQLRVVINAAQARLA